MTLRPIILAKFEEVAVNQQRTLAAVHDDLELMESGLDSLCFAIVVALLEDELGMDPFSRAENVVFPVTFGEFVRYYDNETV
jgi:hypothetical protein